MWYRPIQSVASTSSLISHEMTKFWPRLIVNSKVEAVSEDRPWELTRSVSLLALRSPTPACSVPPRSAKLRRLSGLRVCRTFGLRLRPADSRVARWSRPWGAMPDAGLERGLDGRTAVAREGRMVATVWKHVYGLDGFEWGFKEEAKTIKNPDLKSWIVPGLNCNCLDSSGLSSVRALGYDNGCWP